MSKDMIGVHEPPDDPRTPEERRRSVIIQLEEAQLYLWKAQIMGAVGGGPGDPPTQLTPAQTDEAIHNIGREIERIEAIYGKDPRTGNTGVDFPGSGHHYQKYREMSIGILRNKIERHRDELICSDPEAQKRINKRINESESEIAALQQRDARAGGERMTAPHFTGAVWQRTKDHQCFVTIPHRIRDYDQFTPGTPVVLSLADDPAVQMRSHVRDAGKSRYAKIMRRGQAELADKFAEGTDVRVEVVI